MWLYLGNFVSLLQGHMRRVIMKNIIKYGILKYGDDTMIKPKTYLDTSVISFYFADDSPEKREITRRFIDQELKSGKYEIYI